MKKCIIIVCLLFMASKAQSSVAPLWEWKSNFNGKLTSCEYHNDFIYTIGTFSDSAFVFGNVNILNHGDKDVMIAKWDTLGNLIWAQSIWGAGFDTAVSLNVNGMNELVIVGHSNSAAVNISGNVFNSNGGSDIYIAKYDLSGNYVSAAIYGGAGNDTSVNACIDYDNNIYLVSSDKLTKYSNLGIQVWQQSIVAKEVDYSKIDSSIVVSGFYSGTLTIGNTTINGYPKNIYAAKFTAAGTLVWLKNISSSTSNLHFKLAVSDMDGKVYIPYTYYANLSGFTESVRILTPAGNITFNNGGLGYSYIMFPSSVSVVDSYLVVTGGNSPWITPIELNVFNVNSDGGPPLRSYDLGSWNIYVNSNHGICPEFVNLDEIYTGSVNNVHQSKLGKIGLFSLLSATPSYLQIAACDSHLVTLSGNSIGGMPPLSYSWLPITGLSDTNTNATTFTATGNTSYTLTITDNIGQVVKDTFDISVSPNSYSSTNISICANQTPYLWNGQNFDSTGNYTVILTNMYGCDSVASLNLSVSPCIVCVPNFTINYSPFYNSLTESQSWIITSGTVLIKVGTNVKLDAHQTSYVTLNPGFKADSGSVFIAQAYNGCTAGAPQLPNAKIFNGDPSVAADEIVLYPNPTSGLIYIQHDEKITGIQIFDMVGKLVINQKCAGEAETNIDLSNLPNGVYHVKVAGYNSIKVVKSN